MAAAMSSGSSSSADACLRVKMVFPLGSLTSALLVDLVRSARGVAAMGEVRWPGPASATGDNRLGAGAFNREPASCKSPGENARMLPVADCLTETGDSNTAAVALAEEELRGRRMVTEAGKTGTSGELGAVDEGTGGAGLRP